ncbi:quinone oxidoreductase, partial [Streptomyces sp. NRRL S-444]
MSIVVTGATGALGRLVVEELLNRVPAERVAVVVRSKEKAADLAERGVEVRVADYDAPET